MIRCLVTGSLYGNPTVKTSQSGKTFTTAKLKADGKDGATVWCSLIAFDEQGEWLATLKANATLSVSGRAEVQAWSNKSGEPQAGLSLVVDDVATLKARPRPKASDPPAANGSQRPFAPEPGALRGSPGGKKRAAS